HDARVRAGRDRARRQAAHGAGAAVRRAARLPAARGMAAHAGGQGTRRRSVARQGGPPRRRRDAHGPGAERGRAPLPGDRPGRAAEPAVRYMQEGGFQNNPLMRLTLGLTLVFLVGFWVTNLAVYFSRMDLTPRSVVAYYNGSEEDFRPPRSVATMAETTHMHLPMMGLVLLLLTHLVIFVPMPRPAKYGFVIVAFAAALAEEGAGWLVRFVSPAFAPLKIVGFLGLQASILFLIGALGLFLFR